MPRSLARDHDDKRALILQGAARLFARDGYGRASMAGVAAEIGMSKANLYHYYPSKDDLLFDILDTHLRSLRDRICGLHFADDDAANQLKVIITELLLAYEGADAEHAVQLNAITALSVAKQSVLKAYQRDLVSFLRLRVAALVPAHVAQDKSALRALTMSVFAMVNWHFQWDGAAGDAERRNYGDLVTKMVLQGLPKLDGTPAPDISRKPQ